LGTRNKKEDRLVDFYKQYDMVISKHIPKYSFKKKIYIGNGIEYTSEKPFGNQVRRCKTYPGANVETAT